jgi:hypothetical protein
MARVAIRIAQMVLALLAALFVAALRWGQSVRRK